MEGVQLRCTEVHLDIRSGAILVYGFPGKPQAGGLMLHCHSLLYCNAPQTVHTDLIVANVPVVDTVKCEH